MSFSSNVKDEIAGASVLKEHCRKAEAAGIIFAAATFSITGRGIGLSISTENMSAVKRTIALLEKLFAISAELTAVEQLPKKTLTYIIKVSEGKDALSVIAGLGLKVSAGIEPDTALIEEIISRDCCKKSFLRGVFLGGGSISDPNKVYHLEIVMGSEALAEVVLNILKCYDLNPGFVARKDDYVVYLKESEHIIEFLTHIGAYSAICELENIRILKNINNNINRAFNCENANIDRTIQSAEEQIRCIKLIQNTIGLDKLQPGLMSAAELRLSNPYSSLTELSEIDGSVSRSALNHRIRKIKEIAYSIQNKGDQ